GDAVLVYRQLHCACPRTRFASTVNTEPRLTPLANTTVSKIARICFPLLTSTPSIVDVRTNLPELSKTFASRLIVQSRFTVSVPVRVSWAKAPPRLLSWLPVVLPLRSKVIEPTAPTGTGPVGSGRISVPVVVKPKLPAAVALVHAA